jgi:hypothetical protein
MIISASLWRAIVASTRWGSMEAESLKLTIRPVS